VVISRADLQAHFEKGYGLFAGPAINTAVLRFSPSIARDIAAQAWHPDQRGQWVGDHYELSFPYSDERELVGDILRHIPHVQVLSPATLKIAVKERLTTALSILNEDET